MAGGEGMFRVEVVRISAPAALVVVRIMAGRRTVEEKIVPWALVEAAATLGRNAETEAVERLVERTVLPWALMELAMTAWATAVLVEIVVLPFESVEVMGTRIATGVVGKAVVGAGEGVMTMLVDKGAGGFETTGGTPLAGSWTSGAFWA